MLVTDFITRDQVRLKIGDTVAATAKLSDPEVDQCIADWPDNLDLAAANAAEAIAAKFADGYDFTTDGQVFNRSQQMKNYLALAETLRARGGALEST
jgi:hypothetical protein